MLIGVFLVGSGATLAIYQIGQISGTVSVSEPITYSPHTFTVSLIPGGSNTQTVTLNNAATTAQTVTPTVSVTPPTGLEVSLTKSSVVVPASGSDTFGIVITAVTPGEYTITVTLGR
jgi:hypothetical protein